MVKDQRKTTKPKLKASDLLKSEESNKKYRKRNYRMQYDKCLDLIQTINNHCHSQYTTYNVPAMLPGNPHFDMDECIIFLKEELRKADFYVRLMKPGNVLYISWKPHDVEKVRKLNQRIESKERKKDEELSVNTERKVKEKPVIEFNPDSALSELHLTSQLIMNNPKYSHLKSVQNYKKKVAY